MIFEYFQQMFVFIYNLVTPYTSMVVVKPDELKEIEEELKKEKEERKKEEERLRKLEIERAKARMTTTTRTTTTKTPVDFSSGSGGGFYGDPHFLIPTSPDLYICFDWDGEDGQVLTT